MIFSAVLPEVTPPELFATTGQGPFTVNCSAASFATEDQIRWIKLNIADFEQFRMANSTECEVSGSGSGNVMGSGSGSFRSSESEDVLVPDEGSGNSAPMLPSFLANGTFSMGSILTFNSVNFGDEGYYVCVVTLPTSVCYSHNFTLTGK